MRVEEQSQRSEVQWPCTQHIAQCARAVGPAQRDQRGTADRGVGEEWRGLAPHARANTGESEEEPLALSVLVSRVVQVERLLHFVQPTVDARP